MAAGGAATTGQERGPAAGDRDYRRQWQQLEAQAAGLLLAPVGGACLLAAGGLLLAAVWLPGAVRAVCTVKLGSSGMWRLAAGSVAGFFLLAAVDPQG